MDENGQMILLSALFACLCLMGVIACVTAVDNSAYQARQGFSPDDLLNARWAQESALHKTAIYDSAGSWDERASSAAAFKAGANASAASESIELLKHGVSYRFSFNDSLAADYAAAHQGNGTENIGGVIVEQRGSTAKISGCAYDMEVASHDTSYHLCRVITFN